MGQRLRVHEVVALLRAGVFAEPDEDRAALDVAAEPHVVAGADEDECVGERVDRALAELAVGVVRRGCARPPASGLQIVCSALSTYEYETKKKPMDILCGTNQIRNAIDQGIPLPP